MDIKNLQFSFLQNQLEVNSEKTNTLLRNRINFFQSYFDLKCELFQNHIGFFDDRFYAIKEYDRIILQAYLKNLHLLFTGHTLITSGQYGAFYFLQRQIFEYLLLGKYMSSKKDDGIAKKWLDHRQLDIYDKIIKLLKQPDKKQFREFWILFSNLSHATTSSFQITFEFDHIKNEMVTAYSFLLLSLRCNYHLLNRHLLNSSLRYGSEEYGDCKSRNSEIRSEIKELNKRIYSIFDIPGKKLIRDYESTWQFKK